MKKYFIIMACLLVILTACGKKDDQQAEQTDGDMAALINAKIEMPEKVEVGEKVPIAVRVTRNDQPVDDADEVKFEIWMDGDKDTSKTVAAKHTKNGLYQMNQTFEHNGTYYIQSHVTARSMHSMPKQAIQIGETEVTHDHHSTQENHDAEAEQHHHGDITIHLIKPEHFQANVKYNLSVHIEKSETPINNAYVKYEILKDGETVPNWVITQSGKQGEYIGEVTFPSKGKYMIKIHVENNEGLHEHQEEAVTV
ncbi:FixH family protein [Cytobacillus sp. Hz8]|uniref:FixH family protein n=1 Tax=Cytobacillus sp. Hz8 TaxID=3347168 RepID=UPI0035D5CC00